MFFCDDKEGVFGMEQQFGSNLLTLKIINKREGFKKNYGKFHTRVEGGSARVIEVFSM